MKEIAYVNGVLSPPEEAVVSIDDRGLQFGDGVYEVVRSYDGRLWALERHLNRLRNSLSALWIQRITIEEVREAVERTYAASEIPNALVYFQVTRGVSARDYDFDPDITPTLIVTARLLPEEHSRPREAGIAAITHPEIRWGRVDIKSLNLLANMIAKKAAHDAGVFEALFVTRDGVMTEGASTSLFIVKDGTIVTRENGPHILPGITRAFAIECAEAAGFPLVERPYTLEELRNADEVFLTGTTFGVYSVVEVDGHPIADGRPGPIGRELNARYQRLVAEERDAPIEEPSSSDG